MVDLGSLEVDVFLGSSGRSTRGERGKTSNRLAPRERTVFEAGQEIGYDRFHVGLRLSLWPDALRVDEPRPVLDFGLEPCPQRGAGREVRRDVQLSQPVADARVGHDGCKSLF